jgi:DNA-binding FadR family transcriptional regulator
MPLQIVTTQRLYRQIADQLAELIAKGEYAPGDRLPAERELAQQLGVSRASVREAFIALEIDGLIDIRVGTGVFVTQKRLLPANTSLIADPGPFEVIAARHLVECETAALAARNATAADHARIEETLGLMEEELSARSTALDADGLFHVRIAEASANSALAHLVQQLWNFRHSPMFRKIDEHFDKPQRHAEAIEEHRAIVDAIIRRDADAARAAMQTHLDRVKRSLERNWDQANPNAETGLTGIAYS